MLDPPSTRRVKQAIRAWKTDLPTEEEHIRLGAIAPMGKPVVIEPFEEIHVLRWTNVCGKTMRSSLFVR